MRNEQLKSGYSTMLQDKYQALQKAAGDLQHLTAIQCKELIQYEPLYVNFDEALAGYNTLVAQKLTPTFALCLQRIISPKRSSQSAIMEFDPPNQLYMYTDYIYIYIYIFICIYIYTVDSHSWNTDLG